MSKLGYRLAAWDVFRFLVQRERGSIEATGSVVALSIYSFRNFVGHLSRFFLNPGCHIDKLVPEISCNTFGLRRLIKIFR